LKGEELLDHVSPTEGSATESPLPERNSTGPKVPGPGSAEPEKADPDRHDPVVMSGGNVG
jgi:hypothetical protein